VLLAIWSGDGDGCPTEESDAGNHAIPLDRIVAGVEISGVGQVRDNRLALGGVSSSSVWPGLIERSNVAHGFDIQLEAGVGPESIAEWLHANGIPAVALKTDPGDGAGSRAVGSDEDASRVARFTALFLRKLAALEEPPVYQESASGGPPGAAPSKGRPFTGTIPDPLPPTPRWRWARNWPGERSPARCCWQSGPETATVAPRKRATGVEITGIEDYARALDGLTIGQPVEVVFRRDGRTMRVKITPGRRD
jgi:hypothetical protein